MNLPSVPNLFPASGSWDAFLRDYLIYCVIFCGCGIAARLISGKDSRICRALSVCLNLQLTYVIAIGLYLLLPVLRCQLYPLPFTEVSYARFVLKELTQPSAELLSGGLVRLWLLSLILRLLDGCVPKGTKFFRWLMWRIFGTMLALAVYGFLCPLLGAAVPRIYSRVGMIVVLCFWGMIVLVGLLYLLRKVVLASSGKLLDRIHQFFYSSETGLHLTLSAFTTVVFLAVVFALNRDGIASFAFAEFAALPFAVVGILLVIMLFLFMKFL